MVLILHHIVSNYFILDSSFHYIIIISKMFQIPFRMIPNHFNLSTFLHIGNVSCQDRHTVSEFRVRASVWIQNSNRVAKFYEAWYEYNAVGGHHDAASQISRNQQYGTSGRGNFRNDSDACVIYFTVQQRRMVMNLWKMFVFIYGLL